MQKSLCQLCLQALARRLATIHKPAIDRFMMGKYPASRLLDESREMLNKMNISALPESLSDQLTSMVSDYLPELGIMLLSYFDQLDTLVLPPYTVEISSELLTSTIKRMKAPLTTVNLSDILAGDEIIAALASSSFAKILRSLNVSGGLITDDCAAHWLAFESLEELSISYNSSISSSTMKFIAQLPLLARLRAAHLEGCRLAETLPVILSTDSLPFLSHLELSKSLFDQSNFQASALLLDLLHSRSIEARIRMVYVDLHCRLNTSELFELLPNLALQPDEDPLSCDSETIFETWIQNNLQVLQRLDSLSLKVLPPNPNLATLLSGLTNLKSFSFTGNGNTISGYPTQLERLIFNDVGGEAAPTNHSVLESLQKLTSLLYAGNHILEAENLVTQLQNLRQFALRLENVEGDASNMCLSHPSLTRLINSYETRPTGRIYFTAGDLPSLRSLSTQITSALDLETVSSLHHRKCPQLRELKIEFMMSVKNGHDVVVNAVEVLEPHLRSLTLHRYRGPILPISSLSYLRSLEIAGNPFFHKARDLKAVISALPLLIKLDLAGDAKFKNLDWIKHKGLRRLFIATFEVTDSGVLLAAESLPSLEHLSTGINLKQPSVVIKDMPRLREVVIGYPNADVVEITSCPMLCEVQADSYKPVGLRLSNLPNLKRLDLKSFSVQQASSDFTKLPVLQFFVAPRGDAKATSWHRKIAAVNTTFS
eukprot:TRINITY_DN11397_c0_g1_i1.p1 TRINITY_DN11397_c0_g1~~TRINITY_DN11397_c0_g1_i1.p1  ORF type:complete len:712 (-),score=73.11 TRINITY_DN11397_c0_g1_i1:3033-5168(-)